VGVVDWEITGCAGFGCARVLVVGFDRWRAARGMRIEALACKVGYESQWPKGACNDQLEERAASSCGDAKTVPRILHYRRFLPKLKAASLFAHLPDEKAKAEPCSFTMVCLCRSVVPQTFATATASARIVRPSLPCLMH
jgi:hypothetical protein